VKITTLVALSVCAIHMRPISAAAQSSDTMRVSVHGHEVTLYRTGEAGPTVILEAGGGSSHRVWDSLVTHLSRHARVITYDRPGYGLSEPCDSPRTARRIAHELQEALSAAGIAGPYYLAGWSFGGAIVRTFAGEFPTIVTGLLLIDPAPEDFYVRVARELPDLWTLDEEEFFPALFADSSRRTEQRELAGYSASMAQARASDEKHATPTRVLIAGRDVRGQPDPMSLIWIDELTRWAARRPATAVTVIPGAGHHIAHDNPGAVVDAFAALVRRE
jgi:pimeloyl-ACP methyl ester carboxylesterase